MSTGLTVDGLQGMITGNDFFLLLEPTILDKNVKNNARYMFNLRILPSKARFTQDTPPSKKKNVEVWPEHFCCLLNNIDQGGVGGGVTMVPNTQGGSPVCKKEQNS